VPLKPLQHGALQILYCIVFKRHIVVLFCSYRRSLGKFVVKRADLDHKNHNISAEIFSLYPDQRRPGGETAETADHLLQVGICSVL